MMWLLLIITLVHGLWVLRNFPPESWATRQEKTLHILAAFLAWPYTMFCIVAHFIKGK